MELLVKILEHSLDIAGCTLDVFVQLTAFFYGSNRSIRKCKEG
jgi:hypothetical protein